MSLIKVVSEESTKAAKKASTKCSASFPRGGNAKMYQVNTVEEAVEKAEQEYAEKFNGKLSEKASFSLTFGINKGSTVPNSTVPKYSVKVTLTDMSDVWTGPTKSRNGDDEDDDQELPTN